MTQMTRGMMVEERLAIITGQKIRERGAAGQLRDAAAAEATDRLLAPIRAVDGPAEPPQMSALLARFDAQARAGDLDGVDRTMREIARKGQLTGDRTLDRFLQLASRVAGDVPVNGGTSTTRLSGLIERMPVKDRFRVLLLLASDAAAMAEEPYQPGALRAHLRLCVAELATKAERNEA